MSLGGRQIGGKGSVNVSGERGWGREDGNNGSAWTDTKYSYNKESASGGGMTTEAEKALCTPPPPTPHSTLLYQPCSLHPRHVHPQRPPYTYSLSLSFPYFSLPPRTLPPSTPPTPPHPQVPYLPSLFFRHCQWSIYPCHFLQRRWGYKHLWHWQHRQCIF